MSNQTTRTAGITAFLTASGIDLIVRTATSTVRESVPYAQMGDCKVAGRKAKLALGNGTVAFASAKQSFILKPYSGKGGSEYFWAPLEKVDAKPTISFEEAMALAKAAK